VDGGGVFAGVEVDVFFGEVAGVDDVFGGAEVEVDGDGEAGFFDDFFELGDGSAGGEAAFAGDEAAEVDVDEFLAEASAGVADGVDDAAPVGVGAVEGAFDEEGLADGFGGAAGVILSAGVADTDFDEFGDAFAIGDDHFGEFEHDLVKGAAEDAGFLGAGADEGGIGLAVAHDDDGIVGAGVAIDGDAIEGEIDGVADSAFDFIFGDAGVGGDEAEHGGHVGADHAGAFGDTADAEGAVAARDFDGEGLGAGVAGHDGLGGFIGSFGVEFFAERIDEGSDAFHGHGHADDAGGADEDLAHADAEGFGGGLGHEFGVLDAARAGAGVGVAAVGDDGAGVGFAHVLSGDANAGGLDLIGGEDGLGVGGVVGDDEGEVETFDLRIFDAASDGAGAEAFGGSDTSVDFFEGNALFAIGGVGLAHDGTGERLRDGGEGESDLHETGGGRVTEGDVEVLNGLTGGAFADIVLGAHEDELIGAGVVSPADVDEVGADDVFGIGAMVLTEETDEGLVGVGLFQSGIDLLRSDVLGEFDEGGGADAGVDGHEVGDEGEGDGLAGG
jgi:hypothetical protein